MPFENATPRPWTIRQSRDTSGDVGITAGTIANVLAETFADLRFAGERNAAEAHANAELIVSAVNSYDTLRAVLAECEEYFDNRADADQPAGADYPTPNEEMRLLVAIRGVK